jgi:transcriptional regulator with XRE-family HTH domain
MFENDSKDSYLKAMVRFLRTSRAHFDREGGSSGDSQARRTRRAVTAELLRSVEADVNQKSSRVESLDTTFGERYRLARDYVSLIDAEVARRLDVSREIVRQWSNDLARPRVTRLAGLAMLLEVPVSWLESGSLSQLAANSRLGVRVGADRTVWKETLYALTVRYLGDCCDEVSEEKCNEFIGVAIDSMEEMKNVARKAGGRWLMAAGRLVFCAWRPLKYKGPKRRLWPAETELIIEAELSRNGSTYAAWQVIRERCTEAGLPYPKRVTLHKRVQRKRAHEERFGVVGI